MESLPTIYGPVVSPFVRKVLMVLSIKKISNVEPIKSFYEKAKEALNKRPTQAKTA